MNTGKTKTARGSDGQKITGIGRAQVWASKEAMERGEAPILDRTSHNEIKTVGRAEIPLLIGYGLAGTPFRYLALGTSATANLPAQQTLGGEITDTGLERAEATITQETTTATGDTCRFVKTWTATGDKIVEEIGIFNADVDGVMLGRLLTETITLHNLNVFKYTYDIKFA